MGTRPITKKGGSKDKNHDEIVKHLRANGFSVAETHLVGDGFPDLVVGVYTDEGGHNLLMEVKSKEKWSMSDKQVKFFTDWPGPCYVVTSPDQAVNICRAKLVL
jgi:hypothetical protein